MKVLELINRCDICGGAFSGKAYPVYDENHNKQAGLEQCELCAAIIQDHTDEHTDTTWSDIKKLLG